MRFQAKIPHVDGLNQPDDYFSGNGKRPANDFVISRTHDGEPLSLYGDIVWDRTPYDPYGRPITLSFEFWSEGAAGATSQRLELIEEIRWLTFILMYFRNGPGLSNGSLLNYVTVLRSLARHADDAGKSVKEVVSQTDLILEFLDSSHDYVVKFGALLRLLWKLGEDVTGFAVPDRAALAALAKRAQEYRDSLFQHPPLPTRIYSIVLEQIHSEFEAIKSRFEGILALALECLDDKCAGLPVEKQRRLARVPNFSGGKYCLTFHELLQKYELEHFWDGAGFARNRVGLIGALVHIQRVCSLQIQAFTGMRCREVQNLPLECLDDPVRLGEVRYVVNGTVTKLTRGKIKKARWVTSNRGRDAIILAKRLANLIYSSKSAGSGEGPGLPQLAYLFVSPAYLLSEKRGKRNLPSTLSTSVKLRIRHLLQPVVEAEDVAELFRIDPHRHWHLEVGTKVGEPWRFTSHQLRRSLALYAQKSGLVSLPSLKQQLQHITQEMSLYYSRGSNAAADFTIVEGVTNDFRDEWLAAKPLSQYLGYEYHVLSANEEEVFGAHFKWMKLGREKGRTEIFQDREATLKQFSLGKLAFEITPVGGCTNPLPCDRNPIDVLHVGCITENCKHLVGNVRKLERIVSIKTRQIDAMRRDVKNTPELRHEEAELKKLVLALAEINEKSAGAKPNGKPG